MARIPTLEQTLLEVHQSLGLERPQSKYIQKFTDLDLRLHRHLEMSGTLLASLIAALDLDESAFQEFFEDISGWFGFHKGLELLTKTGSASQQQVLWHLLAYSYVPAMARLVATWTLAGVERRQPIDAGMPGGSYWFLPTWIPSESRVVLPLPQVLDWLFELLGDQSLEDAAAGFARTENGESINGNALRRLQGWRLEGRLPKSSREIDSLFHDDVTLNFLGAYEAAENATETECFKSALDYVHRRGLDAQALSDQIPATAEWLSPILEGLATAEEQQKFSRLVAVRYSKPTMRTIRQRLRVARLVQDGYQRLLDFLCPEVEPTCGNPESNRLLQLLGLFHNIHNLTIQASQETETYEDEDRWFEAHLPPWDRQDLLLTILPSLPGDIRCAKLAKRLTRKFANLDPEAPLEDLVPFEAGDADAVIQKRISDIQDAEEEDRRRAILLDRLRSRNAPWRALQNEQNYFLLAQLSESAAISPDARKMVLERQRELASTSAQINSVLVDKANLLLDGSPKLLPKDVQQQVQALIDQIQVDEPSYQQSKASHRYLQGRHLLMQNRLEDALVEFEEALQACLERGYGDLPGRIAKDAFATDLAENGLVPKHQERYFMLMVTHGMFPNKAPSFEDVATECEEYFWSHLYRPYPQHERIAGPATQEFKALFNETLPIIKKADWEGLQAWIKRHSSKFRKANLKDARRNSVLLQWIKLLHGFERALPAMRFTRPVGAPRTDEEFEAYLKHWREAIQLLVLAWPEQAVIADFKGQTPLMLIAENGDAELTRILAPLSDVDAQDYLGRTALHSAIAGRSEQCVSTILERNPDVATVTVGEENTALHTAVRFCTTKCASLILEEFPGLAYKVNAAGQTPLDMAKDIMSDLPRWWEFMRMKNRRTGSKEDFEAVVSLLESSMRQNA